MTRTRQIAAVDSQMREKMMQSPAYHNRPGNTAYPPTNGYAARQSLLYRLRTSNAPRLLMSSCGSMRELCSSVQSVTSDINNLLASIENILPIITTYLSLPAAKEPDPLPLNRPQYAETAALTADPAQNASSAPPTQQTAPPAETAAISTAQAVPAPTANPMPNNAMPAMPKLKPEDIQQLLNNPLVKNLMANIMAPK